MQELKSYLQEECEFFKEYIIAQQGTIEEQVTELDNCKVTAQYWQFLDLHM